MREIKFRAFDPLYKTMKQVNSIDWTHNYKVSSCKLDDFRWFNGHDTTLDFILMQYTGLRDEKRTEEFPNGQEIYEGDIISTDLKRPYLIVVFRNGCFVFECNDGEANYYDIFTSLDFEVNQLKFYTIIGNIYENPELL